MKNQLGKRLENLSEQLDYGYSTISKQLGFSKNIFGNYVRGERNPDYDTLIKIARLFNVSTDYLLTGKEFKQETNGNLNQLLPLLDRVGSTSRSIVNLENWYRLPDEAIKEITHHFDWTSEKNRREIKQINKEE